MKKVVINSQGIEFTVSMQFKGDKKAKWMNGGNPNYNNSRVFVKTAFGRTSFDFWGSIADPKSTPEEAFGCFIMDATYGDNSFEDFCGELGYDTDSRKALSAWKACVKSNDNLKRIAPDVDIYELANEINA